MANPKPVGHNPTTRWVIFSDATCRYYMRTRRRRDQDGFNLGPSVPIWTEDLQLAKVFLGKSAMSSILKGSPDRTLRGIQVGIIQVYHGEH